MTVLPTLSTLTVEGQLMVLAFADVDVTRHDAPLSVATQALLDHTVRRLAEHA